MFRSAGSGYALSKFTGLWEMPGMSTFWADLEEAMEMLEPAAATKLERK